MLVHPYIMIFVTSCIILELMQGKYDYRKQEIVKISWILLSAVCMLGCAYTGGCVRLMIEIIYIFAGVHLAYTHGG